MISHIPTCELTVAHLVPLGWQSHVEAQKSCRTPILSRLLFCGEVIKQTFDARRASICIPHIIAISPLPSSIAET